MALNTLQNVDILRKIGFNNVCIPAESLDGLEKILQGSTGSIVANKLIPEIKK